MRIVQPDGSELLGQFRPLLNSLDPTEIAASSDIICGVLAPGLMIGYVNAAWIGFGHANGSGRVWGAGECILDAISEPLRGFYAAKFARVIETHEVWEHDYECSSTEVRREFRLRALPLCAGTGLLLVHSLRCERPLLDKGEPLVVSRYRTETGLIHQCSHCRRVRRLSPPGEWDWVPELVSTSRLDLSHGLCEVCSAYYFGPDA